MAKKLACVLAALALAGCTDAPTITKPNVYGRYDVTEVQWGAGGGRDFHVVVRNNPYSTRPKAEVDQAVIDAIQNKITYMITNFTTAPGESARLQYRVEFFFDAPDNISARPLCNTEATLAEPTPKPGRTVILGAFCLRNQVLSEARGTVAAAEPGDPRFEAVFTILIRRLLPLQRINRDEDRCRLPPCS